MITWFQSTGSLGSCDEPSSWFTGGRNFYFDLGPNLYKESTACLEKCVGQSHTFNICCKKRERGCDICTCKDCFFCINMTKPTKRPSLSVSRFCSLVITRYSHAHLCSFGFGTKSAKMLLEAWIIPNKNASQLSNPNEQHEWVQITVRPRDLISVMPVLDVAHGNWLLE